MCFIRDFGLTLLREPKFPPYTLRTVYRLSLVRTVTRELPEQFAMSDKSTKNETPWRGRGFKKPYQGNNSYPFQEFVDANKSNSLNLNLRQRKLVAGVYDTKSDNMAHANAVNLTTIADNWKTAWTPAQKAAASLLLQAERKEDLIHAGRSAHQITEDTSTELFKSCDYQMANLFQYGFKFGTHFPTCSDGRPTTFPRRRWW